MEKVKQAAEFFKMYPKLPLATRKQQGTNDRNQPKMVVVSNGPHTIKILEEPSTVLIRRDDKQVKAFKFIVECIEPAALKGKKFKWLVPMTDGEGQGHYLIDRLQDVAIGEELVVEMKKRGPRNFVEVLREDDELVEEPAEGGSEA